MLSEALNLVIRGNEYVALRTTNECEYVVGDPRLTDYSVSKVSGSSPTSELGLDARHIAL